MIHVIVLILLRLADAGMRRGLDHPPLINGHRGWPGGLDRFASQYTAHQRAATAAAHVQLRGQMRQDAGMVSLPDWLDRYRAGQRDPVWHELRQLGGAVRGPGLREEAQLVCDEMARRARQNVEVIIERLSSAGYRFHSNDVGQDPVTPHFPPAAGAAAHADWLAERFGPVPMTLLSWVRLVGDVWQVGTLTWDKIRA